MQVAGVAACTPVITLDCTASEIPELVDQPLAGEGYLMEVFPSGVLIRAIAAAGIFYGVQSLMQMLPVYRDTAQGTVPITLQAVRVRACLKHGRLGRACCCLQ